MNKKIIFIIILVIISLIILWARYISTKGLIIKEYAFSDSNLPDQFVGKKIIHFSDLHYGSTIKKAELINIVNTINKQKPDIIIFTGDLIDKHYIMNENDEEILITELKKLKALLGKYAVKGNHDYDHKNFEYIVEQIDFTLLKNNYEYVYYKNNTPIIIAGLPSSIKDKHNIKDTFSFIDEENQYFTILITHEPDTYKKIQKYNINMMLAGHSHGGQVRLPFIKAIYTPFGSKFYYEEYYHLDETKFYISSGIGTSKLKLRFFNKPAINLIRLYK